MNNPHITLPTLGRWIAARLVMLSWLYLTLVAGWAALYFLFGDRWWWLFVLNSGSICLFAPLPLVLLLGLLWRRRQLLLGTSALLVLALGLYGQALLPRPQPAAASGATLTVMSFNMLGFNQHPEAVVAALRASGADLIGIQELSPDAAAAIRRELAREYPYQALDPQPAVFGMGVISRYPLRPIEVALPGHWVGTPQVLNVDVAGMPITLANVHAISLFHTVDGDLNQTVREREAQARQIAALAGSRSAPLVVLGDFNTTPLSVAYRTITGELGDAWSAGGQGLGGTFPSGVSGSGASLRIANIAVPNWLVRIDYVFHSPELTALSSRIGPWDGYSDHRPVIATLALGPNDERRALNAERRLLTPDS
jgi:endonuclease/exonuclease/phosphatase (EEP) superfamily protein YafD